MLEVTKVGKTSSVLNQVQSNRYYSLAVLVFLCVLSLMVWDEPWAHVVLSPVRTFVTAVHEMGHAIACLATGGTVSGMTIVSDGNNHGGLTFCYGGMPLIYTQTGYLGTAFFGCFLIFLGQYRSAAKAVLSLMGLAICAASLTFMFGTVLHGEILQGLGSIAWGVLIGAGLIWAGFKLKPSAANFLLIFLATQTALNSLTDVLIVIKASLGMYGGGVSSDASSMAQMTFLPPVFWSVLWGGISIVMLAATLWFCYGPRRNQQPPIAAG